MCAHTHRLFVQAVYTNIFVHTYTQTDYIEVVRVCVYTQTVYTPIHMHGPAHTPAYKHAYVSVMCLSVRTET